MKIDGIDPLTMNKIQDLTSKTEVQKSSDIFSDMQIRRRQETIRGKVSPREENQNYSEEVQEAIKQANKTAEAVNTSLRFQVHEKSKRIMVEIVDLKRNEVIKEIPPEKLLNLIGQIQEMIGLLLDEKR